MKHLLSLLFLSNLAFCQEVDSLYLLKVAKEFIALDNVFAYKFDKLDSLNFQIYVSKYSKLSINYEVIEDNNFRDYNIFFYQIVISVNTAPPNTIPYIPADCNKGYIMAFNSSTKNFYRIKGFLNTDILSFVQQLEKIRTNLNIKPKLFYKSLGSSIIDINCIRKSIKKILNYNKIPCDKLACLCSCYDNSIVIIR